MYEKSGCFKSRNSIPSIMVYRSIISSLFLFVLTFIFNSCEYGSRPGDIIMYKMREESISSDIYGSLRSIYFLFTDATKYYFYILNKKREVCFFDLEREEKKYKDMHNRNKKPDKIYVLQTPFTIIVYDHNLLKVRLLQMKRNEYLVKYQSFFEQFQTIWSSY